jgi:hypothetical protein
MRKKLALFFLLLALALVFAGCSKKSEPPPEKETVEVTEGEEGSEEVTVVLKKVNPVTVVFDNHPDARPHSGLQQARIVYEFLVEGGATRFLAVFNDLLEDELVIGPVRSLRPYFAVQSLEYGGAIAHSGMSVRTREIIKNMNLRQISDNGVNMWRDSARRAPHNLYTNIGRLYKAGGSSEVREMAAEPALLPEGYEEGKSLEIVYHNYNKVRYAYNDTEGVYLRFINDKKHEDRVSGEQYRAWRVILRKTPHRYLPGPEALVDINLEGGGEGLLYEQGRMYRIRWEKKDGKTVFFYTGSGDKVDLSYGNTWIQVVP